MIEYNKNKKSVKLDINQSRYQESVELKRKMVDDLISWIRKTEEVWLIQILTHFFSKDFDLMWAFDCYMKDKDYVAVFQMLQDHELRIVRQSGPKVKGSYLTHVYHVGTLLGTLEIKFDDKNMKWEVIRK